jgi:hypothetical protein
MRGETGRWWSRTIPVLAAGFLILSACGAPPGEVEPPESPAATGEASPTAAEPTAEPAAEPGAAGELPVPREEAVVVDTDTTYTTFDGANLFIPEGSQWGSGYTRW